MNGNTACCNLARPQKMLIHFVYCNCVFVILLILGQAELSMTSCMEITHGILKQKLDESLLNFNSLVSRHLLLVYLQRIVYL